MISVGNGSQEQQTQVEKEVEEGATEDAGSVVCGVAAVLSLSLCNRNREDSGETAASCLALRAWVCSCQGPSAVRNTGAAYVT